MTREEVKEILPILQAYANGKTILYENGSENITDLAIGNFEQNAKRYRIKPEPKYRPFANAEECWAEMQKHQPFGWIKSKEDGSRSLITLIISEENIDINCIGGFTSDIIMKRFTFDDGAVFGILEEEQLMYRPITMYKIVCDRCGEVFGGTDTCSALFSNKEVDIGDYSD